MYRFIAKLVAIAVVMIGPAAIWGHHESRAAAPFVFAIMSPLIVRGATAGAQYTLRSATAAGKVAPWTPTLNAMVTGGGVAGATALIYASSDNLAMRIPIKGTNDEAMPPPEAPSTVDPVDLYSYAAQNVFSGQHADPLAACAALVSAANAECTTCPGLPWSGAFLTDHDHTPWNDYVCRYFDSASNPIGGGVASVGSGCPSGYSGSPCTLTAAPRAVASDGNADIGRSGTTYSPLDDIDMTQNVSGTIDGDTITIAGHDEYGNIVQRKITALPNGNTRIEQKVQGTDPAGNSTVTTQTVDLTPDAIPTGQTTYTTYSNLTPNPADPGQPVTVTETPAPPGSQTTTAAAAPEPCVPGGGGAHACEETVGEMRDLLKKGKEEDKPDDQVAKGPADFQSILPTNPIGGWTLPAHSSACPTMVFDMSYLKAGATATVDHHCTLMDGQAANVQPWMDLLWILVALFLVLSA